MRSAQHIPTGLGLIAAGAVPFALAPAVHGAADLPCPFLAATGLPCPLCGGTRAVALAAEGDAAFLDYNAVWVAVLVAFVLAGGAVLAGRLPPLRRPTTLVVTTLGVAWAYALANASAIA